MDQASIHTSKNIENKRLEWETKGVNILWLSTDSSQLNLIEILWRFMKYEWIELNAYESLDKLAAYIEKAPTNQPPAFSNQPTTLMELRSQCYRSNLRSTPEL